MRRVRRSLADWRWTYLGYDFIYLLDGVHLKVHADDRLSHFLRDGDFEADERAFLKRFLRTGDVFVDVGANVGLFTLLAGGLVGPTGRVFAFEPCSATFRRLMWNVRNSGMSQIACHPMALSDAPGEASLSVSQGEFGAWNSLAGPLITHDVVLERVQMMTWDSFSVAKTLVPTVTMMKIDVEGWELAVIDGAKSLLQQPNSPVLQVEFTPANAVAAGSSCRRLFDRIHDFGYQIFRFDSNTCKLVAIGSPPDVEYCNLYAIKRLDEVVERLACVSGGN
jgi:FkbM family methyltransferase